MFARHEHVGLRDREGKSGGRKRIKEDEKGEQNLEGELEGEQ